MAKYTWIVLTNCDPAHEREFNEWYDNVHIPDLKRVPGVISVQRAERTNPQLLSTAEGEILMSDAETINAKYRYLAYYTIETGDISSFLEEVKTRSNTSEMEISPYLVDAYTIMHKHMP